LKTGKYRRWDTKVVASVAREPPTIAVAGLSVATEGFSVVIEPPSVAVEGLSVAEEQPSVGVEDLSVAKEEPAIAAEGLSLAIEASAGVEKNPAVSGSRSPPVPEAFTVSIEAHQLAPVNVTIVAFLAARRQPAEPELGLQGQFAAGQAKPGGHLFQCPQTQMTPVILHIADGLAREAGPGRELRGFQVVPFAPAADDAGQGFIDKGEQAGR